MREKIEKRDKRIVAFSGDYYVSGKKLMKIRGFIKAPLPKRKREKEFLKLKAQRQFGLTYAFFREIVHPTTGVVCIFVGE